MMMQRMKSPAVCQPRRFRVPVMDRMVSADVSEVACHHSEREACPEPKITDHERRYKYQHDDGSGADRGRRPDQGMRSVVMFRVPTSKRLKTMQNEAMEGIFEQAPANQAAQDCHCDMRPFTSRRHA
jgi:hypothetical protein